MEWKNFDKYEAYNKLKEKKELSLKELLSAKRVKEYLIDTALKEESLSYSYACKKVDDQIINTLQELADECQVIEKYKLLLDGEFINTGENRKVLHHLLRGQLGKTVNHEGVNLGEFYKEQQGRVYEFAKKVLSSSLKSSSGKKFTTAVQVGIGGSDLGPRAMYIALKNFTKNNMNAHFISNVDPDDANEVLSKLDLESTLFILVSKSGTTQETLANEMLVVDFLSKNNIPNPKKNIVCVTSSTSPLAKSKDYLDSIFIDDFIGGRYSSTSPVGTLILTLCFGEEVVSKFLLGANLYDKASLEKDIRKNPALLDALIGVYERNFLNYPSTAVLPYSQALLRFTAHLQQLDMESNGKTVNRDKEEINYLTGPVIFGEPGTNGQHSFYQLLHQGTDIIPLQFIGFKEVQSENDILVQGSNSNQKLKANLVAQIVAFALGSKNSDKNKNFKGERPSSLLFAKKLTPMVLGALLSHFENKVMFQGFIWNLNSFDQEGVQLGKILAKQVLENKNSLDETLSTFSKIMEI